MCPLTRRPIARVEEVPDMRDDPEGWFAAVDMAGDRRVSHIEAVEALKAQLPVDNAALDAAAADPSHWMWQQARRASGPALSIRLLCCRCPLVAHAHMLPSARATSPR